MLNTVIHETLSMILVIFLMQQIVQYMLHGFRELSVLTRMRISAAVADWHSHTFAGHQHCDARPSAMDVADRLASDAHEARSPEHDVGRFTFLQYRLRGASFTPDRYTRRPKMARNGSALHCCGRPTACVIYGGLHAHRGSGDDTL